MALEVVYGRYIPESQIVRGAYGQEATQKSGEKGKTEFESAMQHIKDFSKKEGRNPRILVAKMG